MLQLVETGADRQPSEGEREAIDRRHRAVAPGRRQIAEAVGQKVLHGFLQNRHQTLMPLSVNLARLAEADRAALEDEADVLVRRVQALAKEVRRDVHKMHAFVRFRKVSGPSGDVYVAWYRPDHLILPLVVRFFTQRFASMQWSILTPDGSLHWDGTTCRRGPGCSAKTPAVGSASTLSAACSTSWRKPGTGRHTTRPISKRRPW